MSRILVLLSVSAVCCPVGSQAVEPTRATTPVDGVRHAVMRGLKVVETGARNYPTHRDCFSCHHQTLPLLAMSTARSAGLAIDETLFVEQTNFTRKSMAARRESLLQGDGVGGRALTAGYALWTLQIAGAAPDETTAALVKYLLRIQKDDGSFRPQSFRPPISESAVSCTAIAIASLQHYGKETSPQDDGVQNAIERADKFLDTAKPDTHEALLFRLLRSNDRRSNSARDADGLKALRDSQRDDGGWGQLSGSPSDAYATGQSLFVMMRLGVRPDDPIVERSIGYLLSTQKSDGSWHVKTRSKPVQTWFDNGDPHGDDQFISIAGTGWATAGLAAWMAEPAVAE